MATWGTGISLKGVPGSRIFFITGTPTDTNASARQYDCAFATDTYMFYQRTSSGWPSTGTLLQGPMGINGVDGSFFTGTGAPADSLGAGVNAIYFSSTGEVYTRAKGASWVDTNQNFTGPAGPMGPAGAAGSSVRGTQTYTGNGAPSSDLTTFSPGPAMKGDLYYDLSAGPTLYVLGN